MAQSLEDVILSVWRQAMMEGASSVEIEGHPYPITSTQRRSLKQVDFRFEGKSLRGFGAESGYAITLGRDGQGREEGHAIFGRWAVCSGGF